MSNYGQRLDCLRRSRCQIDRCSLIAEPIGEIPPKVDYYSQAADLKETKRLFPEYKGIYADCQQQNLMRLLRILNLLMIGKIATDT